MVAMAALYSMTQASMPLSGSYLQLLLHLHFVLLLAVLPPHLLVAAHLLLLAAKPLEVEQQPLQLWRWHAQFLPCHTGLGTVYLESEPCILACAQP